MANRNFHQDLDFSNKTEVVEIVKQLIKEQLGEGEVVQNITTTDDKGVDYIHSHNNTVTNIDVKIRKRDSKDKDVALELFSNIERNTPGWVESDKLTDKVLWYWTKDSNSYMVDYQQLKKVFTKNKDKWLDLYFSPIQKTSVGDSFYSSQCIFVPISVLENSIVDLFISDFLN